LQTECGLANVVGRSSTFECAALFDNFAKARAVNVLHDEKMEAVVLVDVVRANDVGMIESGNRPCLTIEPLEAHRVGRLGCGEHLNGGSPPHDFVLAEIDASHAAGGNPFEDFVLSDGKSPPTSLEKILCLKERKDAALEEEGGQLTRFGRKRAGGAKLFHASFEALHLDHAALPRQLNEVIA